MSATSWAFVLPIMTGFLTVILLVASTIYRDDWDVCSKQLECLIFWAVFGGLSIAQIVMPILLTFCIKCCCRHRRTKREVCDNMYAFVFSSSLYYQFSFWLWIAFIVVYCIWNLGRFIYSTYLICIIVVSLFCHALVVCLESCTSREAKYTSNTLPIKTVLERIQKFMDARPEVKMTAMGWHYETKQYPETYYDANGNMQTRYVTRTERVCTAPVNQHFFFAHWRNKPAPNLSRLKSISKLTKIKLSQSVTFGNEDTRVVFYERYEQFKAANRNLDINVDFGFNMTIPGFEERFVASPHGTQPPCWMNFCCFCVSTTLCLSWLYRLAYNSVTGTSDDHQYSLEKEIFVREPASPMLCSPMLRY